MGGLPAKPNRVDHVAAIVAQALAHPVEVVLEEAKAFRISRSAVTLSDPG